MILHHPHPGNLQWGWLACPADTQTLVLLVLLLLNPLLSNRWLLLDHHGFTFTRDTAIPQKQLLNSPRCRALISVVSKASGRSLFDHSFRLYIYVFIRKIRIYTYYTAYIYAGYNSHTVNTNTGTEKMYLYKRIYTVRIYTAYIYLYGLGQP